MSVTDTEQSKVDKAADAVKDHGAEVADTLRDERDKLLDRADSHVRRLADQGTSMVAERGDEQVRSLASTLRDSSRELRSMSEGSEVNGLLTKLAADGADGLESVAQRLHEGGIRGAMSDLRRFGRERPGVFLGLCFAGGLLAGRVLRNADTEELKSATQSNQSGSHQPGEIGGTSTALGQGSAALPSGETGASSHAPAGASPTSPAVGISSTANPGGPASAVGPASPAAPGVSAEGISSTAGSSSSTEGPAASGMPTGGQS